MTQATQAPSTRKVRRTRLGGKRARGWELQRRGQRVKRADVRRLRHGPADASLSSVGGLVDFNAFLQREGLPRELAQRFGHMKTGYRVVYPMPAQLQTLLDAAAVGASRVFDFERLAADPIFTRLAGGAVSSIDALYDDLKRFDTEGKAELESLEQLVAEQGTLALRKRKLDRVTLDVDSTVLPLFGEQEGAEVGPNPRYHGRASYHPLLARVAETGTVVGARLRSGDTSLGEADVEDVQEWVRRTRGAAGPDAVITVRIDAAGDCAAMLKAIDDLGALFLVKARQTAAFLGAAMLAENWVRMDEDADGNPTCEYALLDVRREDWPPGRYRVIAVRRTDRYSGRQTCLWAHSDASVQFFITNDHDRDPGDLAEHYDPRAGIELLIGELKHGLGAGKMSSTSFAANEAALLLKLLAWNLVRRWITQTKPASVHTWSVTWVRQACICIPARLLRHGGRWLVRLQPRNLLN